MTRYRSILLPVILLLTQIATLAQVGFKTIVPQRPIVIGESFQVQFTIEDDEENTGFKPPPFTNFRIVTGPNIYYGSVSTAYGIRPLVNTVYTLDAYKTGRFVIPGATVIYRGETIRSNEVLIEVISKEEAARRFDKEIGSGNSAYFLRPGEDGEEKIRQNLFLKVMVDKKKCFVGEPILATFKLYSRLESRSDIVKNPGFYGFTVYDMINLSDRLVTLENVNGKQFDVHTIRKVQLYPLQAGEFIIDPMEIRNKVEFSRSAINKKTEQQIVEGIMGNEDETDPAEGTETFETEMHTEPVKIEVKSLPAKAKPADFNGAVGVYSIRSAVIKQELSRNEEGIFELVIAGKGNFIQLDAPVVKWPEGMEGFAPVVNDRLDRSRLPLAGQRVFRFPFVAAKAASYTIPSISFSFYNPDSGVYKTVSTDAVRINVNNKTINPNRKASDEKTISGKKPGSIGLLVAGIVVAIIAGTFVYFKKRKKGTGLNLPVEKVKRASLDEIFAPAYANLNGGDKIFYDSLQQSASHFFRTRFDLSGSDMNKDRLISKLEEKKIRQDTIKNILALLAECEKGIYTSAYLGQDKVAIFDAMKRLLQTVESELDKQV